MTGLTAAQGAVIGALALAASVIGCMAVDIREHRERERP